MKLKIAGSLMKYGKTISEGQIMGIKRIGILVFGLVLLLAAQNALAVPAGSTVAYKSLSDVVFTMNGGSAIVDCAVSQFTEGIYAGKYLYTYQIENVNTDVGLSFFSVATNNSVIHDIDYDVDTVNPFTWLPVDDVSLPVPVQSVEALFNKTIKNGSTSAVLWFVSDSPSTLAQGALFGRSSSGPHYYAADLLTPLPESVPEPATIALLGIGSLLASLSSKCRVF